MVEEAEDSEKARMTCPKEVRAFLATIPSWNESRQSFSSRGSNGYDVVMLQGCGFAARTKNRVVDHWIE